MFVGDTPRIGFVVVVVGSHLRGEGEGGGGPSTHDAEPESGPTGAAPAAGASLCAGVPSVHEPNQQDQYWHSTFL